MSTHTLLKLGYPCCTETSCADGQGKYSFAIKLLLFPPSTDPDGQD